MTLAEELQSLEERLLRPEVRSSAEELQRLLAPDFVEFGSSGRVFTREQIVGELGAETARTWPAVEDFRVVVHGERWALVTYRIVRPGMDGGAGRMTLRSSTWVRDEAGRWQMVFHQGTIVPLTGV